MNDLMKGWTRVCLGSLAGAVLGATSFFAVEALMPTLADQQTVCTVVRCRADRDE